MNLEQKHNIYFVGIGGIGMSALAHYFKAQGKQVAGYDKVETKITDALEAKGVLIHFQDSVAHIPTRFLNPETTLVVYTPAIPKSHKELTYFFNNGFSVVKRAQVLGEVAKNTYCLAVAGTHGKTTTTSILGHLLYECNVPLTAFLGGISENYGSNLIQKGTEVAVVEADEFDRSFLTLHPNIACVTSMDADHLDIYDNVSALEGAFKDFSKQVTSKLLVRKGLPLEGITFGINDDADYCISQIEVKKGAYHFSIKTPQFVVNNVVFNLPGHHNLLNAVAAFGMAIEYGCAKEAVIEALATYTGVKRRFTYQIKTEDFVFIDDYAHHPSEINAVYQAVSEMYPNHKTMVVFQPHLYSRTRDFVDDFAESLAQFNEVLLMDIYPARELPIEGVTSSWLLSKINNPNKKLIHRKDIVSHIKNSKAQVVLTLGAGDISNEVQHIKKAFSSAKN